MQQACDSCLGNQPSMEIDLPVKIQHHRRRRFLLHLVTSRIADLFDIEDPDHCLSRSVVIGLDIFLHQIIGRHALRTARSRGQEDLGRNSVRTGSGHLDTSLRRSPLPKLWAPPAGTVAHGVPRIRVRTLASRDLDHEAPRHPFVGRTAKSKFLEC